MMVPEEQEALDRGWFLYDGHNWHGKSPWVYNHHLFTRVLAFWNLDDNYRPWIYPKNYPWGQVGYGPIYGQSHHN